MSDETTEKKLIKQIKTMERLGIDYRTPGVDPENVPAFAKILRFIGVIAVVFFVLWGLFYEWDYSRSPFEQLLKESGVRSRNREEWSYALGGTLAFAGLYFRFYIGALLTSVFFWVASIIGKMFKSV